LSLGNFSKYVTNNVDGKPFMVVAPSGWRTVKRDNLKNLDGGVCGLIRIYDNAEVLPTNILEKSIIFMVMF